MENMMNITVSINNLNDLADAIAERLKPTFQGIGLTNIPESKEEDFLTRKQTAELLNISLVTLGKYTKEGLIDGHRGVGRKRILFKRSEINNALQKIKGGNTY
jgi:excisionase family DNA binding protein